MGVAHSYQLQEIGKRYGRLVVVGEAERRSNQTRWVCRCDCGREVTAYQTNLRNDHQRSCGCLRAELAAEKNSSNLVGQRFGRLTVVQRAAALKGVAAWLCRCDCGAVKAVRTNSLTNGDTKSCGCLKVDTPRRADLTGRRFHRLVAVSFVHDEASARSSLLWECVCDCGAKTLVAPDKLLAGRTKSCGCWHADTLRKHGASGKGADPLVKSTYVSWGAMKQRCTNPKSPGYAYYGGRGVDYDRRWSRFDAFLSDMGVKPSLGHSLDRIDGTGNYAPDNCRWATKKEQAQNRSWNPTSVTVRRHDELGRFAPEH